MKGLIDVYNMGELEKSTRAKIIIKLGEAINHNYGANITEPVVYELVTNLEPDNPLLKDKGFRARAGVEAAHEDGSETINISNQSETIVRPCKG